MSTKSVFEDLDKDGVPFTSQEKRITLLNMLSEKHGINKDCLSELDVEAQRLISILCDVIITYDAVISFSVPSEKISSIFDQVVNDFKEVDDLVRGGFYDNKRL